MIDLSRTYQRLEQPWTPDRLADHYRRAFERGRAPDTGPADLPTGPIALLASAIPPAANMSTALHVLHMLPTGVEQAPAQQLQQTAEQSAADALRRCHRALELDGIAHGYTPEQWLPLVYDIAGPLLVSARLAGLSGFAASPAGDRP